MRGWTVISVLRLNESILVFFKNIRSNKKTFPEKNVLKEVIYLINLSNCIIAGHKDKFFVADFDMNVENLVHRV